MGKVFKGAKWKATDYRDLLSLLFLLTKTMKSKGVIALESHIETPKESTIFSRYPQDHEGPLRRRLHLRHPADDDHEPGRPAPGRGRDGKPAREAPPRGAGARRTRCTSTGRRPAGAGHRRRRAGRHQDHGRDHRAAGRAGRDDRLGAGRHLPGRVPGLWPGRPDGRRGWPR